MPATTAQSIEHCRLFTLPSELRNQIYEYVVRGEPALLYQVMEFRVYADPKIVVGADGIPEPPLLETCKTVRKEAIGIFYNINTIRIQITSFDSTPALLWKHKQIARPEDL